MKMQLIFPHLNKIYKLKDKFLAAMLIFSMLITGIMMPEKVGAEEAVAEEVTVKIGVRYSGFTIQDKLGNILFETVNGKGITQHNTERIKYISYEKPPVYDCEISPITDFLEITGDINMVITCFSENEFNIDIYRGTQPEYHHFSAISGTVITISDDGVKATAPTTKIRWKKVKKAERYVLYRLYRHNGKIKRRYKLDVFKKTSCTVIDEKGVEYQIAAQRKIKGKWKTLRTFNITI